MYLRRLFVRRFTIVGAHAPYNFHTAADYYMAVYTKVSFQEARDFLKTLSLGDLQSLEGCAGGIENTNYFATTEQGAYVLTLFERLSSSELPFYLHFMRHLALQGIPVPNPAHNANGEILHQLLEKPAAVVNRLPGKSILHPEVTHCVQVGDILARMHLAGKNFSLYQANLRGFSWWNQTGPVVQPYLNATQKELLHSELAYQNHIHSLSIYKALPCGPIHADLFRDNVLFDMSDENTTKSKLTGVFDFYFAGVDSWLFDIAVVLNDWCIDLKTGAADTERTVALLQAYSHVRPLLAIEKELLPAMLRAGALRFWLSRLWDKHLPRQAQLLQAHDPAHFERVLRGRVLSPVIFTPSNTP